MHDLPSPADLERHRDGISDADAIARAADLFALATGVTETPADDPLAARLIRTAILDMAWYLQTVHEDQEAVFSPFSGERIGSYSYSKMTQAVQRKRDTGVAGFDAAVEYFAGTASVISVDSEWVFTHGYGHHVAPRRVGLDPHLTDLPALSGLPQIHIQIDQTITGGGAGGGVGGSGDEIEFDADGFPILHREV